MKNLLFCLLLVPVHLSSQPARLHGFVTVLNSRFDTGQTEYLADVQIVETSQPDSLAVRTDSHGRFSLTLAGDPEKSPVFLRVSKEGYQVINERRLQILPGGPDTVQFIMAPNHYLAAARQRYYDSAYSLAMKNLLQRFNEKKLAFETLQNQAAADTLRINALRRELAGILNQFEVVSPAASYFSERYANCNLDITPPVFQDAFRLLHRGDPDSAFNLLQRLDPESLLKREQPVTKPAGLQGAPNKPVRPENDLSRSDLIKLFESKTDLQYIRMDLGHAETGYETLIQLDSNSWFRHHMELAEFLYHQDRAPDSRVHIEKCLPFAASETDSAALFIGLASVWAVEGDMEAAAQFADLGLTFTERLLQRDSAQHAPDLARYFMDLGRTLYTMQRNPESESLVLRALAIYRNLIQTDPAQYEPYLADAIQLLGKFYVEQDRKAEAEKSFLESLEIYERLEETHPTRYNRYCAFTLETLGWIYAYDGQQKKGAAERYYLRALERYEQLAQNIPPYFEPLVAETAWYLGDLYYGRSDFQESKKWLNRAWEIQERFAQYDLSRFQLGLGNIANSLGYCYYQTKEIAQAEQLFLRALEIRQQLVGTSPGKYERDLAYTAAQIGRLYIGQKKFPEAEQMLLRALETLEPLAQQDFEQFGPLLAITENELGAFYLQYTNNPMAESLLLRAVESYTRLAPYDAAIMEPVLAAAALDLTILRLQNGQLEEAAALSIQALSLLIKYIPSNASAYREEYKRAAALTAALRDSLAAHGNYPAASALQQLRAACADTLWIYDLAPLYMAAAEYGNLSWQFLFNGQYAEAEQAARNALNLDNAQHWVKTNLGHALLLRGDLKTAKQVYSDFLKTGGPKAKSMLLNDLDILNAAGVHHRNMAKARKWLEKQLI